jgi:hypothetical protein
MFVVHPPFEHLSLGQVNASDPPDPLVDEEQGADGGSHIQEFNECVYDLPSHRLNLGGRSHPKLAVMDSIVRTLPSAWPGLIEGKAIAFRLN